jgi:hypothetical protein
MRRFSALYRSVVATTFVEVLISAALIFVCLGGILTVNTKSLHTLRATQQAAASSQILQQRIETVRTLPWPEMSNSTALAAMLQEPTQSEKQIPDLNLSEIIRVTVPQMTSTGFVEGASFTVRREGSTVWVETANDFRKEPTLLFSSVVSWRDSHGRHERQLKTIVCRAGLTRSGIYGSVLGCRGPGAAPAP